jgi:hypothetical protein
MTKRYFSSRQLYILRNDICVEALIEKALSIPCRVTKGCFRFLCPLCNGFNTAVNPETNLARCFGCEKNFNTIDLVMLIRKSDFVQSVKFLQKFHQNASVGQIHDDPETISGVDQQSGCRIKTQLKKTDGLPDHIGNILGNVVPSKQRVISEKQAADYSPNKKATVHQGADNDRILKLEQKIEYLGRQIEAIVKSTNVNIPSN